MTYPWVIIIVSFIIVVGVLAWRWMQFRERQDSSSFVREREEQDSLVARTIVIHTRDDRTVRGVLMAEHIDRVTLSQATYYAPVEGEVQIDGMVHIPRDNIGWMQEITITATVEPTSNGARKQVTA